MAKAQLVKGTTSYLADIFIQNNSVATGAGLTGLVFNTASLTAYYHRSNSATATVISLATMTAGTWSTAGFVEVDATNMPGVYQIGIPNAALASGANNVSILLKGATNMAAVVLEIELTGTDNQDAVHGGMTALPNAAAAASGGLPTIGSGAGQIAITVNGMADCNVVDWKGSAAPAMTGDAFARLGAPAGASVSADIAAVKTDTAAVKVQTDKLTFTVANQVDSNVLDWKSSAAPAMTGDAFARLGAPAGASVSADIAAIQAKTTNLPASPAAVGSAMTLSAAYDFAKGTVAVTESYAADGAAPTPVQALMEIMQFQGEKSIAGTTMTVKKRDGATTAATYTLDSAVTPASITRAT